MVKRFKFYARGLALVRNMSGSISTLSTVEFEADTYVDLMGKANVLWLTDDLVEVDPRTMGITDVIGAVLDIKRRTFLEVDDEIFVSSKLMFDSVGGLTMTEYEELQGELLFKYKGK